eukprot:Gregarina_sp_Poly_1__7079@NODE_386_length_9004_cov_34_917534_g315_i0_p5_GENE_NODE_386_length_9004_cov_34_917534_g315_i0NODE_386_length_9004_cov_34_917534_g315_i0_p5_ORF_typecomplete_len215_score13_42_NODE_386_length_9004_cov_34_917534_g315_i032983942
MKIASDVVSMTLLVPWEQSYLQKLNVVCSKDLVTNCPTSDSEVSCILVQSKAQCSAAFRRHRKRSSADMNNLIDPTDNRNAGLSIPWVLISIGKSHLEKPSFMEDPLLSVIDTIPRRPLLSESDMYMGFRLMQFSIHQSIFYARVHGHPNSSESIMWSEVLRVCDPKSADDTRVHKIGAASPMSTKGQSLDEWTLPPPFDMIIFTSGNLCDFVD